LVIARSALLLIVVTAEALLLPELVSAVGEETDAMLLTVTPPPPGLVEYVEVMVMTCPLVSVPSAQGKALVQPPELETKVRPAGAASVTETPVAAEGPLFVTVMV
jgi:hypothetical protein